MKDGALLTFEFRQWSTDASRGALPRNHKGPCAVYLKKVDSAIKDKGAGDGWFKIFANGVDLDTNRWCTDELIDNKGLLSVQLPKGLQGGAYLARPEILALHASTIGDPQFYTGCAQIFLESSGNLVPESTVAIPGYVDYNQPATNFDVWNKVKLPYTLPGPPVAKLKAGTQGAYTEKQTEGLRPAGCIMENGQWCGVEVASYTDQKGCWASHQDCWDQSRVCYATATPSGHIGCKLWDNKCTDIEMQCKAKNFNGPPNKGKDLTPPKKVIDVGKILPQSGATAGNKSSNQPTTPAADADKKPETSPSSVPSYENKPKPATESAAKPDAEQHDDTENTKPSGPAAAKPTTPANNMTSAAAPVPTPAPQTCSQERVTTTVVETKTVTVTASAGGYGKRSPVYQRRHGQRA